MQFDFLAGRIQSVLMVDTSHDIVYSLKSREFPADASTVILLAFIVAMHMTVDNKYVRQIAYLVSCTLVNIVIFEIDSFFTHKQSFMSTFQYTLIVITVVMVTKALPETLRKSVVVSRAEFTFVYGTSSRLKNLFTGNRKLLIGTTVVTAMVYAQKKKWYPKGSTTYFPVRAVYEIVRHLTYMLGIELLLNRDSSADALQDMVYCLGIVALISFIVSIETSANWKDYALWKIGDFIITDVNSSHNLSFTTLGIAMTAVGTFVSLLAPPNKKNIYVDLCRVLASTTVCRALLALTDVLPLFDRIVLRFLFVLVLF